MYQSSDRVVDGFDDWSDEEFWTSRNAGNKAVGHFVSPMKSDVSYTPSQVSSYCVYQVTRRAAFIGEGVLLAGLIQMQRRVPPEIRDAYKRLRVQHGGTYPRFDELCRRMLHELPALTAGEVDYRLLGDLRMGTFDVHNYRPAAEIDVLFQRL